MLGAAASLNHSASDKLKQQWWQPKPKKKAIHKMYNKSPLCLLVVKGGTNSLCIVTALNNVEKELMQTSEILWNPLIHVDDNNVSKSKNSDGRKIRNWDVRIQKNRNFQKKMKNWKIKKI